MRISLAVAVNDNRGVVPPTFAPKRVSPAPAKTVRFLAPFTVDVKVISPMPAPLLSDVVPAKATGPVIVMLLLVVVSVVAREIALDVIAIAPVVVPFAFMAALDELTTVSDVRGVLPPKIPLKVIDPVPAVIERAFAPLIVEENETLPAPAPVVSVVVPPPVKETAPVREILLSVVVKAALAREIAVDVTEMAPTVVAAVEKLVDAPLATVRLSGALVPPTMPLNETAPVPAVIETALAPLRVEENEISPAPTPLVKVLVPPPLKETGPTNAILLSVVVKATLGMEIALDVTEMAPVVVTAAEKEALEALDTVKESGGVVPPTAAPNETVPVPAAMLSVSEPLIVEENETLPMPIPVFSYVVPVKVTGPVMVMLLFVVVSAVAREIALDVTAIAPV